MKMNSRDDDLDAISTRLSQSQRLSQTGVEAETSGPNQFATHVNDPLVGKKLDGGRYHILSVLGRGGMSVVYKAGQELVDRPVAIKTLTVQLLGDPIVLKRFQREIHALSKLSHPNIVTAFDCVVDNTGQPYFIMDFLDGESLAEVLYDEVRFTEERVQRIFIQVCNAVAHAHSLQVLHRDLKPANIMLLQIGTPEELVKVVDFGLAKLSEDVQKLTVTGECWGSPSYMSPEQVHGKSNDFRSDIYSIGCVMFEALTGRPPFQGTTPIDTVMMQINAAPPTFAEVDPELKVHPALEAIVLTCLAKNPDERFQTMSELSAALQELDLKSPATVRIAITNRQASAAAVLLAPAPMPNGAAQGWSAPPGSNQPPRPASIIGRRPTAAEDAPVQGAVDAPAQKAVDVPAQRGAVPQAQKGAIAPPPSVVRPSSAMRSGGNRDGQQRVVVAVLILVAIFGIAGLGATIYFLKPYLANLSNTISHPSQASQVGTSSQPSTVTPAQTDTNMPAHNLTSVPTQAATTAPTQVGTTTTPVGTTAPTQVGTTTTPIGTTAPTQVGTTMQQSGTAAPGQTPAVPATNGPAQVATHPSNATTHDASNHPVKSNVPIHQAAAKPPFVAHAKPNQQRKPRPKHSQGGGDVGGNYVPPPVNDSQRWYDIQKSWSH